MSNTKHHVKQHVKPGPVYREGRRIVAYNNTVEHLKKDHDETQRVKHLTENATLKSRISDQSQLIS